MAPMSKAEAPPAVLPAPPVAVVEKAVPVASRLPESAPEKPAPPRKPLVIPPILLEDDSPPVARPSGPGERYALGGPEPAAASPDEGELPAAYGTERLLLVARDPHWLYAHWDMTADQLRAHNAESRDSHLVVRVFENDPDGALVEEQHVHPESRSWFLHAPRGGTKYVAQLGLFTRAGEWKTIATSPATVTPTEVVAEETAVRFETIPVDVPFTKVLDAVKEVIPEHVPLVQAIQELREAGFTELPSIPEPTRAPTVTASGSAEPQHDGPPPLTAAAPRVEVFSVAPVPTPSWTAEQERALAEIISIDAVRRVWMGSLEITELIRRQLEHEMGSQAAAARRARRAPEEAAPGGVSSVSSPFGGEGRRQDFWFNVNAELIIYGATEPDASVTIGGRKIRLRPDGTFSFRFALPDGSYELPVRATSAEGEDTRAADLRFRRATEYRGEVAAHPQDANLKPPRAEHVA